MADRSGSNPDDTGTPTKSVERLLAEKEALRKQNQENQKYIDQLERELKAAKDSGEGPDRTQPTIDPEQIGQIVESRMEGVFAKREAQARQANEEAAARQASWNRAVQEFPDASKPESPLFKRAQEILLESGNNLAEIKDGQVKLRIPTAEYFAVKAASEELARKSTQSAEAQNAATFASSGGSQSAAPVLGSGQLSDEEFMKLSTDERRAYQKKVAGLD